MPTKLSARDQRVYWRSAKGGIERLHLGIFDIDSKLRDAESGFRTCRQSSRTIDFAMCSQNGMAGTPYSLAVPMLTNLCRSICRPFELIPSSRKPR